MSRNVVQCFHLWFGCSAALGAWSSLGQLLFAWECDAGWFDWSCSLNHFLVLLDIWLELAVWTEYWYFLQRLYLIHLSCEYFVYEIVHLQSCRCPGWRHSWSYGFRSCDSRHSASMHLGFPRWILPCWLLWFSEVFSKVSLSTFSASLLGHRLINIVSYCSSSALHLIFNWWCSFSSALAEKIGLCLGSTWIFAFSTLWHLHLGSCYPSASVFAAQCSQHPTLEPPPTAEPRWSLNRFQPWADHSF